MKNRKKKEKYINKNIVRNQKQNVKDIHIK
jgi:hypothetical protein